MNMPQDNLDQPVQQWCDKHWGVVRDGVNNKEMNGIMAAMLLQQKLLEDDIFMKRLGYDEEKGEKADANPSTMNAVMMELSPICCHLGDKVMEEIYDQARRHEPSKHKLVNLPDGSQGCQVCQCYNNKWCKKEGCIHCGKRS